MRFLASRVRLEATCALLLPAALFLHLNMFYAIVRAVACQDGQGRGLCLDGKFCLELLGRSV